MRLKIISTGDLNRIKLVNAETNEPVENVSSIDWHFDSKGLPVATIEINDIELKVDTWKQRRSQAGDND